MILEVAVKFPLLSVMGLLAMVTATRFRFDTLPLIAITLQLELVQIYSAIRLVSVFCFCFLIAYSAYCYHDRILIVIGG